MKLLTATTKQYLYGGLFYAAVLSVFFGYIIGAAAVVIIGVTNGVLSVASGETPKQAFIECVAFIAGAVIAVAVSVIVSYVWGLILGT